MEKNMLEIAKLINDEKTRREYVSKTIYAKIGSSLLLRSEIAQKRLDSIPKGKHQGRKEEIHSQISHIKKMLTTEKRVLDLIDFPEIKDNMWEMEYEIPTSTVSFANFASQEIKNENVTKKLNKENRWVVTVPPFLLKLEIGSASKDNDLSKLFVPDGNFTPESWFLWDGRTFISYIINESEPDLDFSRRAREVICDIYSSSDIFDVGIIGPSPIHPDIQINVFSKEKLLTHYSEAEIKELSFQPILKDKNIHFNILLADEKKVSASLHLLVQSLFYELESYINYFYRAMSVRSLLLDASSLCIAYFESLSKCLLTIHEIPAWKLIQRHKNEKQLGSLTTNINILLAKEFEFTARIKEWQASLERDSQGMKSKALLLDYLLELTTESTCIDRISITNAFSHADQVLSRRVTADMQLASAVIGGIIGGIMTIAVVYFTNLINTPNP